MRIFAAVRAGRDDRTIVPVDPAVVALVAVRALNEEAEAENEALRVKLDALKREADGPT